MRKLSLFAVLILGIMLLAGCERPEPREYCSKDSYFDGAVVVEYNQFLARHTYDYLAFQFYEKGVYEISFSITPNNKGRGQNSVPRNFTMNVQVAPREIVVKQYIIPDFLRITITKDGESESHNFS